MYILLFSSGPRNLLEGEGAMTCETGDVCGGHLLLASFNRGNGRVPPGSATAVCREC